MDFKETHAEGTPHFMAFKGPKLGGLNCNLVWHLTKNNTEARSPSRPDTIGWQQSQNSFQISQECKKENWLLMSLYCPCKHSDPSFLFALGNKHLVQMPLSLSLSNPTALQIPLESKESLKNKKLFLTLQ